MQRVETTIVNKLGLHARPSAKLTQLASRFTRGVWMRARVAPHQRQEHHGRDDAGRREGRTVVVEADGPDEAEAIEARRRTDRMPASAKRSERDKRGDMFSIHGTAIGGGIAIGRARVLESQRFDVARYHVPAESGAGRGRASRRGDRRRQVRAGHALREHLPDDVPAEARALLEVHAMILDDPMLAEAATRADPRAALERRVGAAPSRQTALARQFEELEDAYLRERGRDVQQVAERVLKSLSGIGRGLAPAQRRRAARSSSRTTSRRPTCSRCKQRACGFAIDLGGTTSHTAILARSMNVPAVVGLHMRERADSRQRAG